MATGTVVVLDDCVITLGTHSVADQAMSMALSFSANMLDVTTFDSDGNSEFRPGLRSFTGSLNYLGSEGTNEVTTLLWTAWSTGASLAFTAKADGGSTGAANPEYSGTFYVSSFSPLEGSVGATNASTASLQGTAAVTRTV
jgi:hypothetical protein